VPTPKVGQINLIKVRTAKRNIRRTRNDDTLGVPSQQRDLTARRHLVNVVRSVAGHQQITLRIKSHAVRDPVQTRRVHLRFTRGSVAADLDFQHIVLGALDHIQKAFIRAQGQAIGKSKGSGKYFRVSAGSQPIHPRVFTFEVSGIGEIEVAFRIEHGEVWVDQLARAHSLPAVEDPTLTVHPDQRRQLEIADIQLLRFGEGKAKVETADPGHFLQAPTTVHAVNLAQFTASPKSPIPVEGEAFGVVETLRVSSEAVEWDGRPHLFVRQSNVYTRGPDQCQLENRAAALVFPDQEDGMRLVMFEPRGHASRLGVLRTHDVVDLAAAAAQSGATAAYFASTTQFLEAGTEAHSSAQGLLSAASGSGAYAREAVRLCAPIPRPGKIIAIGLNYRDHALEQGVQPPPAPLFFAKFPTSVTGPYDAIVLPTGDPQVDYEAELAVIIGRRGKAVSEADAMEYVGGYTVLNDVSARKWQFADKQWVRGKSCDTFCPMGPWLTTRDDVPDPHQLTIAARVNGVTLQDSNTNQLIFGIPQLIAYISASITLEPGDVIATGTPAGVGVFRNPPIVLKDGDIVEVEIQGLGTLRNPVRDAGKS
jgi:2-keto-4-pentenoate hydratase/2-oxohepta-3-ene-1,7-dioic acid hydratase in catechol pathway